MTLMVAVGSFLSQDDYIHGPVQFERDDCRLDAIGKVGNDCSDNTVTVE
jgi:hypothetical protein